MTVSSTAIPACSAPPAASSSLPTVEYSPEPSDFPIFASWNLGRRREFCHFAGCPSPSMLKRLLQGEGAVRAAALLPDYVCESSTAAQL